MQTVTAAHACDREQALQIIINAASPLVDLDYEGGSRDVIELGKAGRQVGVSVMFRGQQPIVVESMRALLRGLQAERDTFRQRLLFCCFGFSACATDDLMLANRLATEQGDVLLPGEALQSPYTTCWSN